jgi:hypothetical protein
MAMPMVPIAASRRGAAYNPRTGTYIRGGAISGPAGERGFIAAYNPRTGNGVMARGGHNVYGSWGSANVKHGSDFAHIAGGTNAAGGNVHWRNSDGNHGFVAGGKGGDIYAGRDGNVYRRDNGQWQKHTPDGWDPVQKPSTDNLKQHGENFAAKHPDVTQKIGQNHDAVTDHRRLDRHRRCARPRLCSAGDEGRHPLQFEPRTGGRRLPTRSRRRRRSCI